MRSAYRRRAATSSARRTALGCASAPVTSPGVKSKNASSVPFRYAVPKSGCGDDGV
jgi:hypothetical protein